MRRIFLDIGTHTGQTLDIAVQRYPHFDLFIGVEPVEALYLKALKIGLKYPTQNIKLYKMALDKLEDTTFKKIDFYEDETPGNKKLGSSLLADKTMRKNRKIKVDCQDIRAFFRENIQEGDEVVLKIDVEGKEYDLFEALLDSGMMKYVVKIYAEWHWNKVPSITKERHNEILTRLNEWGYNLKGRSKDDEFYNGF